MNKILSRCIIVATITIWVVVLVFDPTILSDKNKVLADFVDQQLIGVLGVVVTITLASAANLHLELNKLEEKYNRRAFYGTRTSIKLSVYSLIFLLFISIVLIIIKSLLDVTDIAQATINGAALVIIMLNILILTDITESAFKLEPEINEDMRSRVEKLEKAGKECVEWAEGFCHEGRDDKTGEYKHEYGVSGGSHDRGEWEAFEDAVATLRAALDGVKQ